MVFGRLVQPSGARGARKPSKKVAPTFSKGFQSPRGRPDPPNRRFPAGQQIKKHRNMALSYGKCARGRAHPGCAQDAGNIRDPSYTFDPVYTGVPLLLGIPGTSGISSIPELISKLKISVCRRAPGRNPNSLRFFSIPSQFEGSPSKPALGWF